MDTWQNQVGWIYRISKFSPSIKFPAHILPTCVEILDTLVKILPNKTLITDLFTKPTDSHNYLYWSFCNPINTKNSLPYSQLICIKRICTNDKDFEKHHHSSTFAGQRISHRCILSAQDKVWHLSREDLLAPSSTCVEIVKQAIYSITTYPPKGKILRQVISNS